MKSFVLQVQGGFWTRKEVCVDEILRVVDRAMDVSTPIKGVVCPPQVSVDSRTTSDILLDYRDEGGRVLLRNGDQKHFCPSLSRCHPVSVYVAAPVVFPSAKHGFINLSHTCTYFCFG